MLYTPTESRSSTWSSVVEHYKICLRGDLPTITSSLIDVKYAGIGLRGNTLKSYSLKFSMKEIWRLSKLHETIKIGIINFNSKY